MASNGVAASRQSRRWVYFLPLVLFAAIGMALAIGLTRDPSTLPSALLDKPAPEFDLPPLEGRSERGFSRADLVGDGAKIVNVFASWCVPCRVEHPQIARLSAAGVPVHGINYKDAGGDALAWLEEMGDPYALVGADRDGRVGIEWGVYGVPETFVIDSDGRIVHKHVGPVMPRDLEQTLLPLLDDLR